jgi:hypothetical protein
MKFLCVDCDAQMVSVAQMDPGDETVSIVFRCPDCAREIAMLANPMETQMVRGLCVDLGGRGGETRPFEAIRSQVKAEDVEVPAKQTSDDEPRWSAEAEVRLARVPGFVRGMVRRLYLDWARERGVDEITVTVMDEARSDLGMDGI